jgi:excisionase family DNA binding protein
MYNETQPRLASMEEAGRLLGGISRSSVENLIKSGRIKIIRVTGRKRAVLIDSIDSYIEQLTEQKSA